MEQKHVLLDKATKVQRKALATPAEAITTASSMLSPALRALAETTATPHSATELIEATVTTTILT